MNGREAEIQREVESIPAVQELERALTSAEDALERLEDRIVDTLAGTCGKLLGA